MVEITSYLWNLYRQLAINFTYILGLSKAYVKPKLPLQSSAITVAMSSDQLIFTYMNQLCCSSPTQEVCSHGSWSKSCSIGKKQLRSRDGLDACWPERDTGNIGRVLYWFSAVFAEWLPRESSRNSRLFYKPLL